MPSQDASIIILTKNEEKNIDKCLRGIFSQKTEKQYEVIVIDSGSTDATIDIASGYDVHIYRIKPEDFSHSKTRNLGVKKSRGEFLIFITDDAYPANNKWLNTLLLNFTTKKIVGVFGKQIPKPDATPLVQRQLSLYYGNTKRINLKNIHMAFQTTFFFSNVNSAIRKNIWQKHNFDEDRIYAEDVEWATWAILHGYQTIYDPAAAVYHSHNQPLKLVYKRSYQDGRSHKRIFIDKYKLKTTFKNSLGTFFKTANLMKDMEYIYKTRNGRSFLQEVLRTILHRTAQSFGYLLGHLDSPIIEPYMNLNIK